LARAVKRIRDYYEDQGEKVLVVAQKSVAQVLHDLGVPVHYVVERYKYQGTTDTEDITAQAVRFFRANGPVDEIVTVAQPIQQIKCHSEVYRRGFNALPLLRLWHMVGHIGFDRESEQWWTRGPIRLLIGSVRQVLFGFNTRQHGPTELSE